MYLTISKRFEISSSARLWVPAWNAGRNLAAFGPASTAEHGCGFNYVVHFVFTGPVDPETGMLINVVIIKDRIKPLLDGNYDHKFLNRDCASLKDMVPTAENLARLWLEEMSSLFDDVSAKAVVCHVQDSLSSEATAYTDGRVERHHWVSFSAARRTFSPNLSDAENHALFGVAASQAGHGHNYRLRVTMDGEPDPLSGLLVEHERAATAFESLRAALDHKNLNVEVPALKGLPITTESLARFVFERLATSLPVARVRLHELPEFFAEYDRGNNYRLAIMQSFHAAHRLNSPTLSSERNLDIYGKCNNPLGHGHEYMVEATLDGEYDERSGTLFDLARFNEALTTALQPWAYKHLDMDTGDFNDVPSTGENIVTKLWPRLNKMIDNRLARLRLWETPNNRFALRRDK